MDLNIVDTASRPERRPTRRRAEPAAPPTLLRAVKPAAPSDRSKTAAQPDGHEHPLATAHF